MLFRRLVPVVIAGLTLGAACAPAPSGAPAAAPATDPPAGVAAPAEAGLAPWAADMLSQVNAQRSANGAAPLAPCAALARAAQSHTEDQAAHHTMTHTGSDGSNISVRAARVGYTGWSGLAENVAMGYPSVTAVMTGWMNSAGHRANLLNAAYNHIGLGLAYDGATPYWTQDFGANGAC